MQNPEYIKVAIIGDQGIGKRSLLTTGFNVPKRLSPLYLPIEFNSIQVKTRTKEWQVLCYDSLSAGHTMNSNWNTDFASSVVSGADVIFMCYSCNSAESLENLKTWYKEISLYLSPGATFYLVGTRSELESRPLDKAVKDFSKSFGFEQHIKLSSRNGDAIRNLFTNVIKKAEETRYKGNEASTNFEIATPSPLKSPRNNGGSSLILKGSYSKRLHVGENMKGKDMANSKPSAKRLAREPEPITLEDILLF